MFKNDNDLKEPDIYYRYITKSERIKYPELKLLLDQIKTEGRKRKTCIEIDR